MLEKTSETDLHIPSTEVKDVASTPENVDASSSDEGKKLISNLNSGKDLATLKAEIEAEIHTYEEFQAHEKDSGEIVLNEADHAQHEANWQKLMDLDQQESIAQDFTPQHVSDNEVISHGLNGDDEIEAQDSSDEQGDETIQPEDLAKLKQEIQHYRDFREHENTTHENILNENDRKEYQNNLIKIINHVSEDEQILFLKETPYLLQYVQDPSEAVQLAAISANDSVIQFIDNPSEVVLRAVKEASRKEYKIENEENNEKNTEQDTPVSENTEIPQGIDVSKENDQTELSTEKIVRIEDLKDLQNIVSVEQEAYKQENTEGIRGVFDARIGALQSFIPTHFFKEQTNLENKLGELIAEQDQAIASKDSMKGEQIRQEITQLYEQQDALDAQVQSIEQSIQNLESRKNAMVADLLKKQYRAERMNSMQSKLNRVEFAALQTQLDRDSEGVRSTIYQEKFQKAEVDLTNLLKSEAENILLEPKTQQKFQKRMENGKYEKAKEFLLSELSKNSQHKEYASFLQQQLDTSLRAYKQYKKLTEDGVILGNNIDKNIQADVNKAVVEKTMKEYGIPWPTQREIDTASFDKRDILIQQKEYAEGLYDKLLKRENIQSQKSELRRKAGAIKNFLKNPSFLSRASRAENLRNQYDQLAGLRVRDETENIQRWKENQARESSAQPALSNNNPVNIVPEADKEKPADIPVSNDTNSNENAAHPTETQDSFDEKSAYEALNKIFGENEVKKYFKDISESKQVLLHGYPNIKGIRIPLQGSNKSIILSEAYIQNMENHPSVQTYFRGMLDAAKFNDDAYTLQLHEGEPQKIDS